MHNNQSETSKSLVTMQPILVTGAHRSGTTWVGKMLAANGQSAYISEPLNVLHRPGVLRAPIRYWYTYIYNENETDFLPGLLDTLSYRYHYIDEMKSLRSIKDFLRMLRDSATFLRGRFFHQKPLLKDPFAVFSAPWFAKRFDCQVVIVVRHPAAFANSLKRLNWTFDFSNLLAQPKLMEHWLEPFRLDLEKAIQFEDFQTDVIYQASLLWNLIYSVVKQYQKKYSEGTNPRFYIIRHEDFSLDPLAEFSKLYNKLGLNFNQRADEIIRKSSSSANPGERSQNAIYAVRLDSQVNLTNWKRRLSQAEIAKIRDQTQELASFYYPDFSWM